MNPEPPIARVTSIKIGRLHNLGNYEHVRYEIAVDVPEGASASQALKNLERVLDGLDPKGPVPDHELARAVDVVRRAEKSGEDSLEEWERVNLEGYRDAIAKHQAWRDQQKLARYALDQIGGTGIYSDAKEKWDQDL